MGHRDYVGLVKAMDNGINKSWAVRVRHLSR